MPPRVFGKGRFCQCGTSSCVACPGGLCPARFRPDEPDIPRHAALRRYRVCRMAAPTGRPIGPSRIRARAGAPLRAAAPRPTRPAAPMPGCTPSASPSASPPLAPGTPRRCIGPSMRSLPRDCWVERVDAMRPGFHAAEERHLPPLPLRHRHRRRVGLAVSPAVRMGARRARSTWPALRAAATLLHGEHDFQRLRRQGRAEAALSLPPRSTAEWVGATRPARRELSRRGRPLPPPHGAHAGGHHGGRRAGPPPAGRHRDAAGARRQPAHQSAGSGARDCTSSRRRIPPSSTCRRPRRSWRRRPPHAVDRAMRSRRAPPLPCLAARAAVIAGTRR